MTNTTSAEEVLKTDVLGRVKTPRAWQEVLLDEFERSWVSGLKFAALVGINYQTFATWVQRKRRDRGNTLESKVAARADHRPGGAVAVAGSGGERGFIGHHRQAVACAVALWHAAGSP